MMSSTQTAVGRILAPTDFSEPARLAVLYAARLALDLGASLTLLHVLAAPNEMIGMAPGASVAEELEAVRALASVSLASLEAEVRALGVAHVDSAIDVGSGPAHAVVARATSGAFDLIVLATHGRHGLPRMVLGSVAEHVVRAAACPVLTLRPH